MNGIIYLNKKKKYFNLKKPYLKQNEVEKQRY